MNFECMYYIICKCVDSSFYIVCRCFGAWTIMRQSIFLVWRTRSWKVYYQLFSHVWSLLKPNRWALVPWEKFLGFLVSGQRCLARVLRTILFFQFCLLFYDSHCTKSIFTGYDVLQKASSILSWIFRQKCMVCKDTWARERTNCGNFKATLWRSWCFIYD